MLVTACVTPQGIPTPSSVFDYDPAASLDAVVRDRQEGDGFIRVDLSYASPAIGRVPAYLYEPTQPVTDPAPALLMMHGVPGSRISFDDLARAYARAGVYVLTITGPWVRPLPYRNPRFIPAPLFDEHDRAEVIQVVQDLRRAVDYLETRPGIDPERIAFVGHSAGAMVGAVLAGVEHRIAAYVLMAPTPGWVTWLRSHQRPGMYHRLVTGPYHDLPEAEQEQWVAGLEPLEATRWIGGARGTPIFFQGGTADRVVPREDLDALFAAAADPKTLAWYDVTHAMGAPVFADQVAFLAHQLGFDRSRFSAPEHLRRR